MLRNIIIGVAAIGLLQDSSASAQSNLRVGSVTSINGEPYQVLGLYRNLGAFARLGPSPMFRCGQLVSAYGNFDPLSEFDIFDVQRVVKQAGAFVEQTCPAAQRIEALGAAASWKRTFHRVSSWTLYLATEDLVAATGQHMPAPKVDLDDLGRKLTARADAGDVASQFSLGILHQYSRRDTAGRLSPDYRTAAKWYTAAADRGLSSAMYALAQLHKTGQGVPLDDVRVRELLDRAAKAGHIQAMSDLGEDYIATARFAEGVTLLQKAADIGHPDALNGLGALYQTGQRNGVGFPKDYPKALQLYQKAANGGSCPAHMNLGGIYFNGDGVKQDGMEAARWFSKAASCPTASDGLRAEAAVYIKKSLGGKLPPSELAPPSTQPRSALVAAVAVVLALAVLAPRQPSRAGSASARSPFPNPPTFASDPLCGVYPMMSSMDTAVAGAFGGNSFGCD